jgi:hypothetical protein
MKGIRARYGFYSSAQGFGRSEQRGLGDARGYEYANSASITFPVSFTANPDVSMISGVTTVGVPWAGGAIILSTSAVTLRLCGAAANNAGYYGYIAAGPWK